MRIINMLEAVKEDTMKQNFVLIEISLLLDDINSSNIIDRQLMKISSLSKEAILRTIFV